MGLRFSDKEIVQQIKNGSSERVLNFLYETTQYKIRNWILNNNGSEEEAQDIFQDAVLSFYNYVLEDKFDEGKSVEGFVFSIGRNMWINRAKQKKRMVSDTDELERFDGTVEHDYMVETIDNEKAQQMNLLLNQLGERCKELLTYSIFYNMKMEEICEKMGFNNANTAKTKNYKCKQRLKQIINENKGAKEWLYR